MSNMNNLQIIALFLAGILIGLTFGYMFAFHQYSKPTKQNEREAVDENHNTPTD